MGSYTSVFITMEIVFILVAIIFAVKVNKTPGIIKNYLHFWIIQIVFVIGVVNEIIWVLQDNGYITFSAWQGWIVNGLYIILISVISFEWFRFISTEVSKITNSKLIPISFKIQTVVLVLDILFTFTSIWTGWVYKIDANGYYTRGSLHYFLHTPLCYGHWIFAIICIIIGRKKCDLSVRYRLRNLFLASSITILGSVLQLITYKVPFLDIAISLGSLMLFMDIQKDQILSDELTSLNNRSNFIKTYNRMVLNAEKYPFYLFVADIDDFKNINDKYGHLVGDKTLLIVSYGLRKVAHKYPNVYICRYGGDEFVVMARKETIGDVETFNDHVNEVLSAELKNAHLDFKISFTVGFCEVSSKDVDVNTAFEKADKMLYEEKNK